MRSIISPNQILPISTKLGSRPTPMPIRQLLIILFQNLFRQFRIRNNHVQSRTEPNRYNWPVELGPFSKTPEPDRLYVIEVSDDRPGAWTGWKLESEALEEGVEDEKGEK